MVSKPFCLLAAINHLDTALHIKNSELNYLVPFKHLIFISRQCKNQCKCEWSHPHLFLNSLYTLPFPSQPVPSSPWMAGLMAGQESSQGGQEGVEGWVKHSSLTQPPLTFLLAPGLLEASGHWHRTVATTAKNFYLSSDCAIIST